MGISHQSCLTIVIQVFGYAKSSYADETYFAVLDPKRYFLFYRQEKFELASSCHSDLIIED